MSTLSQMQKQFTAPLRDATLDPFKGIEKKRYQVYQELLQNNIQSLLSQNFPVCAACLGPREWGKLISKFYQKHGCHTPYFHEIGRELIEFLQRAQIHLPILQKHPYLVELAQYEYFELQLSLAEDPMLPWREVTKPQLKNNVSFVPWPLAHLMVSLYPLHLIKPKKQVVQGDVPTCLMVHRDTEYHVGFAQLSIVSAQVWMSILQLQQEAQDLNLTKVAAYAHHHFKLEKKDVENSLLSLAKMRLIGQAHEQKTKK